MKSNSGKRLYKVRAVHEDSVEVVPYSETDCSGCAGSCSSCTISLTALTPKHFELKPGMTVRSNISTPLQSALNISALLVPILCAVLGFLFSEKIASLINASATETFKAVVVLVFLFVPSCIIFLFTRHRSELVQLQITKIEN